MVGSPDCKFSQSVQLGRYELRMYGGNPGIETVSISMGGPITGTGHHATCRLNLELTKGERYRVLSSRAPVGLRRAGYA